MKHLKPFTLFESKSNNNVDYYLDEFSDRIIDFTIYKLGDYLIINRNGQGYLRLRKHNSSYWIYLYNEYENDFDDITETTSEGYPKLSKRLYSKIYYIYLVSQHFLTDLGQTLFLRSNITRFDLNDRLDEFEVIKDYDIDFISLNHLFDFYNCSFDEEYWIEKFRQIKLSAHQTVQSEVK